MNDRTTPLILRIGLDALHLYNIRYKGCDSDKLKYIKSRSGNVKYHRHDVIDPDIRQTVEYIKIADNCMFADLVVNTTHLPGGGQKTYVDLILKVHYVNGDNLNNLSVADYQQYLEGLEIYISEKYGVFLDVKSAQIKSMEINTTMPLRRRFNEYARVMIHLISLIPRNQQLSGIYVNEKVLKYGKKITEIYKEAYSISVENKQFKIKIYDKRREMLANDKYDAGMDILRIELTLRTPQKIKNIFDTVLLNQISDDMVAQYFYNTICVDYYGRYEKWCEQNKKDLKELIQERRQAHRHWQYEMLTFCLNCERKGEIRLLDINDWKDSIENDKHNNRARTVKAVDNNHFREDISTFFENDREKLPEIKDKITEAYRNSIITSSDDV